MAATLSLAIRTVHVLAMAVLLGGAGWTWLVARADLAAPLPVAIRYEWVFWGALGVLVLTGVGNLGARGPGSAWGRILSWKLGVVIAFVLGSLVRSLAVVHARRATSTRSSPGLSPPRT